MCKVSIIMPIYNKEKYVAKAIASVLRQTETDWELLIIDDGSTDASFEICSGFKDERIRVFREKNGGVSKARNIGLEKAQGKYITFVDGDDYLAKDYLETLYNPECEMIISGLTKVNLAGKELDTVKPELTGKKKIREVADTFYDEQIKSGIYGFVAGKMVKRAIIEENRLRFDESIRLAEDYDFFLKVYQCIEEILFLKNTGYYYIQETENSGIMLDDSKTDFWKQIEIQKKTKEFLKEKQCFRSKEEEIYLKRVTGYVYTLFLINSNSGYKEFCDLFERLKGEIPQIWSGMQGFGKACISLYDKNYKLLLFVLLKMRNLVRKVCRK